MALMLKSNVTNTLKWLKSIDLDTLTGLKQTLFFFVIIDMFVFYWYMKWKRFGMAMFIVCIMGLIVILLLEKRRSKMEEEERQKQIKETEEKLKKLKENPKEEKKEEVKEKKSDNLLGIDLGIGTPEEYNKRAEEALGSL